MNAGRSPLIASIDGTQSTLDLYLFVLTDTPITAAIANARARGVTVRTVLEPCPGDTGCSPPTADAMTACKALLKAGAQVKWANQAFPKTHAKTAVFDGTRAWVTTINLESQTFTTRRDYGLLTADTGVIGDFGYAFQQDWQNGDPLTSCSQSPSDRAPNPGVQDYQHLIVSPDNGAAQILGFIASAQKTLKIQMEQADSPNSVGVVPALVAAIKRGVQLQLLLSQPSDQNVTGVANAVNAAGGQARYQVGLKPHAKMIIVDGARMFIGSQNLTQVSLYQRREIGWIISDPGPIACFQQVFDADWDNLPSANSSGICPQTPAHDLAVTSAASFAGSAVAPNSIAAIFGGFLATRTATAAALPLPLTLAGSMVQMQDSAGAIYQASLFAVGPHQINLLIPAGAANGTAQFTVTSADGSVSTGSATVAAVSPSLFSADGTGRGLASADVQSGSAPVTFAASCTAGVCTANPIDVGNPAIPVFLALFGTGIRGSNAVQATVAGLPVQVVYAGVQGVTPGLDQVNLALPPSLAGKGTVDVAITVDGQVSNTVQVQVK